MDDKTTTILVEQTDDANEVEKKLQKGSWPPDVPEDAGWSDFSFYMQSPLGQAVLVVRVQKHSALDADKAAIIFETAFKEAMTTIMVSEARAAERERERERDQSLN